MVRDPLEFKAAVDRYVVAVEALRTAPYTPPWTGCADPGYSTSGEDFAVVALRVSRDFYDPGDDGSIREALHDEFETEHWGVVLALEKRWGAYATVSAMDAYVEQDQEGRALPPLLEVLCGDGFDDLQVWEVDARKIAVGVAQASGDEPFVLFAAVTGAGACLGKRP
ncbi:hypothetical protein [Streptomyces sp. NPDC055749]